LNKDPSAAFRFWVDLARFRKDELTLRLDAFSHSPVLCIGWFKDDRAVPKFPFAIECSCAFPN